MNTIFGASGKQNQASCQTHFAINHVKSICQNFLILFMNLPMISSNVTKNFQLDIDQTPGIHPLSHYFYPCYHKGFLAIIFMSKIDNNLYEIVYFLIIGQKVYFYLFQRD